MAAKGPHYKLEDSIEGLACGIDEVGRGPLAGPVMAACVHIPRDVRKHLKGGLNDSKQLTALQREKFAGLVRQYCPFGIGQASVAEIDAINIRQATHLAMRRAYEALCANHPGYSYAMVYVDGRDHPALPCAVTPVIGGDALCMAIAAASIIAKVERDQLMADLHMTHPHYGWNANAGYGVKAHIAGMRLNGVTEHHRRSFAPVRAILALTTS